MGVRSSVHVMLTLSAGNYVEVNHSQEGLNHRPSALFSLGWEMAESAADVWHKALNASCHDSWNAHAYASGFCTEKHSETYVVLIPLVPGLNEAHGATIAMALSTETAVGRPSTALSLDEVRGTREWTSTRSLKVARWSLTMRFSRRRACASTCKKMLQSSLA